MLDIRFEFLYRYVDAKERAVLAHRLDGFTLAEVSAALGRSRENIRIWEGKALARIREHLVGVG